MGKGWLGGPFLFTGSSELLVIGRKVCRSGVQQADKPRAGDDLTRSFANAAAAAHAPINLPSRDHVDHFFRF